MPELPEVESVRLSLVPHLRGRVLAAAEIRRRDVVAVLGPRGAEKPLPRRNPLEHLLQGARVTELRRRGKQLALLAEDGARTRALVVHLGMSGQFFCLPPGAHLPDPSHVHLVWRLDSGARLIFRDPRRFGGLWALPSVDALDDRWAELGPDALTISAEELGTRLALTRRAVKAALLDQAVLAGVGNIYADESLHAAGIHPLAIASRLPAVKVERLAGCLRDVLSRAILAGGSSLGDGTYIDANGRPGTYQLTHAVYGRAGEPCMTCSTTLRTGAISSRTSVWCARCQPKR